MKKSLTIFAMAIAIIAINFNLYAANRFSRNSGNWNSTSTWSSSSGGSSGASVPVAGDIVTIEGGHDVTVTANAACASINFTTITATSLTINSGITLTVSGAITIPRSGSFVNTIAVGAGILNAGSIAFTSGGTNVRHEITISTGTVTVTGNVTGTGGTGSPSIIFSGAGLLQLGGSIFTDAEGTLTPSTGTVEYNSTLAQTVGDFTYNNLTLSGSGAKTTTGASISGKLSMQGTATTTGTVATYGSAAVLEYKGSAPQITGTEFITPFLATGGVIINNANGVTLNASKTINTLLTMTSGNITTGANILTLTNTSVSALSYSSGVIITGSTGGFKRWFAHSTVSNVLFPVGTSTTINTITLSFPATAPSAGSLTAFFNPSDPGTNSAAPLTDAGGYVIDTYSKRGYWQITAADGLSGGIYNISLRGQGFNPSGNEITTFAHLRILKRSGPGVNWSLDGAQLDASLFSNADPVFDRININTGFSQFAMGGSVSDGNPLQGPLPVELVSFTSIISDRDVKLNWTTASENNNAGFEILRSDKNNNENWIKVGYVTGNGTKTTPTNYSFEDKKLNTGKYNYRLKQIDYNGNYEYFAMSGFAEIGTPNKFEVSQNYPNPFNPVTKIDYQLPENGKVKLVIYDMLGREVKNLVNEAETSGFHTAEFDASSLASGNYIYRLSFESSNNKILLTKNMILIK